MTVTSVPEGTAREAGRPDVYLHIGLPKTGTSHLQQVLWLSRERLSTTGVLVPGATRQAQRLAVWDLMGRRPRGSDQPDVAGSWQALVDAASGWNGSHVVVSEEFLTNARPRQARRAVQAFAPARVHVVVTVRDLGQVVGSVWQQGLAKGHTWSWAEFVDAVRDPESGPASAGAAFWLHQDLVRVLDTWESVVPRERIHLVTVPPAGSSRHLLLERFATATRLDTSALVTDLPGANVSVGVAEAEVLRRLNLGLGGRLNERQYSATVQHAVKPALRDRRSSARIQVPAEELGWLTERATAMVAEARARGYRVVGDLEDLVPDGDATGGSRPDHVEDSELAEAAVVALVAVTEKYAELSWRTRNREGSGGPAGAPGLASQARAQVYRTQMAVIRLADRHRWGRKVMAGYLRRSSRGS